LALLNLLEIERFFEFGAAAAYTSNVAAMKYPNINCCAFEANPYHHQYINNLKIHDNLKNLHYINGAISSTTPSVDFNIHICKSTLNDFGAGMLSPASSILLRNDGDPDLIETKTVSCVSFTIDQVLNTSEPYKSKCSFWLDIEGYSLKALKTCSDFSCVDLIYTEMHDSKMWKNQTKNIELIEYMLK
jgi:FkbM family methyltransferase